MTNAQTEARAIALAAAGQVHDNEDARCVETLVERLVATALAAKDAELERLRQNEKDYDAAYSAGVEWMTRAKRVEAQLAEANKALDAIISMDNSFAQPFGNVARRAREAQGGNGNG